MDGINLVNAEIPFTFNGQEYKVKKANLQQVIQFQRKAKEVGDSGDAGGDLALAAYALSLVLSGYPDMTEEYILANFPGDLDSMQILGELGFLSQQKVAAMDRLRNALAPSSGKESSVS